MEVDDDNNVSKKQKQNVNLDEVETYVRSKQYPLRIKSKGDKVNFRRACKKYLVVDGQFKKEDRLVMKSVDRRQEIIHDVHDGAKSVALASHRGQRSTLQKVSTRFYWQNMAKDVIEYIKKCDKCQRQKALTIQKPMLTSIPVPSQVFVLLLSFIIYLKSDIIGIG